MKRTNSLLVSPILAALLLLTGFITVSHGNAQREVATVVRAMQPLSIDPVSTRRGAIAGIRLPSGFRAYLGISFAAPQPASWSGIFNADQIGPECMQLLRAHDINHIPQKR